MNSFSNLKFLIPIVFSFGFSFGIFIYSKFDTPCETRETLCLKDRASLLACTTKLSVQESECTKKVLSVTSDCLTLSECDAKYEEIKEKCNNLVR